MKNYPRHENSYEGAFRWGEILQGERKFSEAADAFARVKGPPAFEVRAAANELQCLADVLTNAPKEAEKAWADGVRARAARTYDHFQRVATDGRSVRDGVYTLVVRAGDAVLMRRIVWFR